MGNTINKFFIFAVGAALGSFVTWKLIKGKYERIAQEEIDSVKEVFYRRRQDDISANSAEDEPEAVNEGQTSEPEEEISEYKDIINRNGYSNVEGVETMHDKPYVIAPEIFGDDPDYETISLTYYADGVLTDENNCIIDPGEIEDMIGEDSLDHFGEYEDDSVFVRNEERMIDYEILAVTNNYDD